MSTNVNKDSENTEKIRRMRSSMMTAYIVLGMALYIISSAFLFTAYNTTLKKQAQSYTSVASMQTRKNIDRLMTDIEKTALMIYEDTDDVEFYPSADGSSEYDDLQREDEITDKMFSLSLMENYCDFGIVYSNGHSAGKITNGTLTYFGSDIFDKLYGVVSENGGELWTNDYKGEHLTRIYYLKMLNENAVLVTSVYNAEIASMITPLEDKDSLQIFITDENGDLIFSSSNTDTNVGDKLPDYVESAFGSSTNLSVAEKNCIGSAVECEDVEWNIYCCVSGNKHFKSDSQIEVWMLSIGIAAFIALVLVGYLSSAKYTDYGDKIKNYKDTDSIDSITGLLSGLGVEEEISERIETCQLGSTYAFILLKFKEYSVIRERLGSDYTDSAVKKLGDLLSASLGENDIIGINEDGEFVAFAEFSDFDLFKAHNMLKERCNEICESFKEFYVGEEQDNKIYIAMGVCIYPDNGKNYEDLYENASQALDVSLRAEKDSCIFFDDLKK